MPIASTPEPPRAPGTMTVRIRRETPADVDDIRTVVAAACEGLAHSAPPAVPGGPPGEATLVDRLRADQGWIPSLSLVAEEDGVVIGHVVCTRGHVDDTPALGLGPLSVRPERQRAGVGSGLVGSVLEAADSLGESLVVLLGDPAGRFRYAAPFDLL